MISDTLTNTIWIGLLLSVLVVFYLFFRKNLKHDKKYHILTFYFAKIAWIAVICFAIYWAVSVPYVGNFHKVESDLPKPSYNSEQIEVKDYIKDYNSRIEYLEEELIETKKELRAFRSHYQELVKYALLAIVILGMIQIFYVKKEDWIKEVLEKNRN